MRAIVAGIVGLFWLAAAGLAPSGCSSKKKETVEARPARRAHQRARPQRPSKVPAGKKADQPAELAPHPDFPTPELARTEKIFLMEEPDRGPQVTSATLPSASGLTWSVHGHCEVNYDRVACSRPDPGAGGLRAHWRVGRRGGRVALAQRYFGPRVEQSVILEHGDAARIRRMIELDGYNVVQWSRHFSGDATQYSSRKLDGGNALKGCGYMKLLRDAKGEVSQASCLQWSGSPMKDTRGVVHTRLYRNAQGLVTKKEHLGEDEKPITSNDGVHREVIERDRVGHFKTRRFFDQMGFPALSAEDGCYAWRYLRSASGLLVRKECLGPEDRAEEDDIGVCRYEYTYDGRGCATAEVRYEKDTRGRCADMAIRIRHENNDHCDTLSKICLGAGNKRTTCVLKGPAEYRHELDGKGRVISTKHFDAGGQPGKDRDCEAFETRNRYDERGNTLSETSFGPAGEPVDCGGTGYHGVLYTFDEAGRTTEQRFVDKKGQPGTNLGCAVRRYRHDNYDHQVEKTNYDAEGKIRDVLGQAIQRFIYDQGHRTFGVLLFDAHDRPARYRGCFTGHNCPSGTWHAVRIKRRPNGSVSHNLFFNERGQLTHTMDCSKKLCWK